MCFEINLEKWRFFFRSLKSTKQNKATKKRATLKFPKGKEILKRLGLQECFIPPFFAVKDPNLFDFVSRKRNET